MARILAASAVLLLLIGVVSAQSLIGCYKGDDATISADAESADMTNVDCAAHCGAQGKAYAATGEGKYCTCLADLSGLTAAPAAECNSPCTGDHTGDMCGGADGTVTVASTAKSSKRGLVEKLRNAVMKMKYLSSKNGF
ncbi:uncharacterized protein LOC144862600 [Branchiostoma floridae x Branchiostoma japonicum]